MAFGELPPTFRSDASITGVKVDALQSAPSAESLNERKERKGILLQGAMMFNAKPKNGLAFLEKEGMITWSPSDKVNGETADTKTRTAEGTSEEDRKALAVAKFLRSSSRLDKKEIGEYISRPDQLPLLKAFIGTFDFKGVSLFARRGWEQCRCKVGIERLKVPEIHRGRHARAARDLPFTRRGSAHCSYYRDLC